MPSNQGGGHPARSFWLLLAVLALLPCSVAHFCSFWNNKCIDPLAQTAQRVDVSPPFFEPVTFFYAFDSSASGKGEGPMTKTAFWLRYEKSSLNTYGVRANYTSEVALYLRNLTGPPSGTNNGCDGIWGPSCSRDIKFALRKTIFGLITSDEHYEKPLETALGRLTTSAPRLPSCGASLFDVASIPVQGRFDRRGKPQYIRMMN